jgi:hypothetical protein
MPTTRRRKQQQQQQQQQKEKEEVEKEEDDDNDDATDQEENDQVYLLDGVEYPTYQEMVNAKRKRNQEVLQGLGFLDNAIFKKQQQQATRKMASARGIKKQKIDTAPVLRSRKSSRLTGKKTSLVALDYYVNDWTRNTSFIKVEEGVDGKGGDDESIAPEIPTNYKGRVNDGSDLTLEEAIALNDPKWIKEDTVESSTHFQTELLANNLNTKPSPSPTTTTSPASVLTDHWRKGLMSMVEDLSIDKEEWVAKVTPDRIYSVTTHPSESKLIACAGDKQGYVGLWDVDAKDGNNNRNNGVHLFRVHSSPVCCLEWASNDSMISASYDGTVRRLNVETGVFEEIFATYDDSDSYYAEELGYGLDEGSRFWLQHVTVDPRYKGSSNPCLFLSTSAGSALHMDLRVADKQRITFHEKLSEKKINTLR